MKLPNGTVLPHGLLSQDSSSAEGAFSKSYKNYSLKVGIVVKSIPTDSSENITKFGPEYDVVVVEQDSNRGITPITYKNCVSADSFGSMADFFEKKFRAQTKSSKYKGRNPKDQDGATVLLLCLDGHSDKAIIVSALSHPKRKTKLTGDKILLAGEYNGVAVQVNSDGSCNLTFKGATDTEGKAKDAEQGNTTVDIEKDGTFQVKNKGVTQRMEKKGKYTLTTEDSTSVIAKKSINLTTEDSFNLKAKADANAEMVKLAIKASGSANFEMASLDIQSQGEANLKAQMINIEGQSMVNVKATQIVLEGFVNLGSAGGAPALVVQTQFLGIGNLGIPVLSTAIGPFSTKVTMI